MAVITITSNQSKVNVVCNPPVDGTSKLTIPLNQISRLLLLEDNEMVKVFYSDREGIDLHYLATVSVNGVDATSNSNLYDLLDAIL